MRADARAFGMQECAFFCAMKSGIWMFWMQVELILDIFDILGLYFNKRRNGFQDSTEKMEFPYVVFRRHFFFVPFFGHKTTFLEKTRLCRWHTISKCPEDTQKMIRTWTKSNKKGKQTAKIRKFCVAIFCIIFLEISYFFALFALLCELERTP